MPKLWRRCSICNQDYLTKSDACPVNVGHVLTVIDPQPEIELPPMEPQAPEAPPVAPPEEPPKAPEPPPEPAVAGGAALGESAFDISGESLPPAGEPGKEE